MTNGNYTFEVRQIMERSDWYQAICKMEEGRIAGGFGTTEEEAIEDCRRDINKINSLS